MDFAKKYSEEKAKAMSQKGDTAAQTSKDLTEALTSMWNAITSNSSTPVYNKKLHVRHSVVTSAPAPATPTSQPSAIKPHETSLSAMENMTPEQMFNEVSQLRRKYDELVSFSVNLTAERDILNNTLEQTKRDLNREIARKGGGPTGTPKSISSSPAKSSFGSMLVHLLIVGAATFFMGVRMTNQNQLGFLYGFPIVGNMLAPVEVEAVPVVEIEEEEVTESEPETSATE